jgi:hypothetical protein
MSEGRGRVQLCTSSTRSHGISSPLFVMSANRKVGLFLSASQVGEAVM